MNTQVNMQYVCWDCASWTSALCYKLRRYEQDFDPEHIVKDVDETCYGNQTDFTRSEHRRKINSNKFQKMK